MVEPAEPSELRAIAALNFAAYAQMAARVPAWQREDYFGTLVENTAKRARFWVLRERERIAGCVAYCRAGASIDPIPGAWASVLLLAVDPSLRRRGAGHALASACIGLAKAEKTATLGLFTSELMAPARTLYESLGFRIERELERRHGLRYWLYRREIA